MSVSWLVFLMQAKINIISEYSLLTNVNEAIFWFVLCELDALGCYFKKIQNYALLTDVYYWT